MKWSALHPFLVRHRKWVIGIGILATVALLADPARRLWIYFSQDIHTAVQRTERYRVPEDILLAMAYADNRLHVFAEPKRLAWIRMMPWRPERTITSTYLSDANETVEAVLRDPTLSLGATAEILAGRFNFSLEDPHVLENWRSALEQWGSLQMPLSNQLYADYVLHLVNDGFIGTEDHGKPIEVKGWKQALKPRTVAWPTKPLGLQGLSLPYIPVSRAGYASEPLQNRKITHIIIHATENDFFTIADYLARPSTRVGTHYLVRASDGFAIQMADERAIIYHDACFNDNTIGIEHEGYSASGKLWFSDKLYKASAKIVRDIASRYQIPLDREHILGHNEAPDCSDHTDPGSQWDWAKYMNYVQEK
jgi:hypothetical protein